MAEKLAKEDEMRGGWRKSLVEGFVYGVDHYPKANQAEIVLEGKSERVAARIVDLTSPVAA